MSPAGFALPAEPPAIGPLSHGEGQPRRPQAPTRSNHRDGMPAVRPPTWQTRSSMF
jgi:hypothetical protein